MPLNLDNMTKGREAELRSVLGKMSDRKAGAVLGLARSTACLYRAQLGIAAKTPHTRTWSKKDLAMLGKVTDRQIAIKLGCSHQHVTEVRRRRGIKSVAETASGS